MDILKKRIKLPRYITFEEAEAILEVLDSVEEPNRHVAGFRSLIRARLKLVWQHG